MKPLVVYTALGVGFLGALAPLAAQSAEAPGAATAPKSPSSPSAPPAANAPMPAPTVKAAIPVGPAAESPAPAEATTRELVDSFSEADLAKVLPLLRENYISKEKLSDQEVSRATVEGLLERLAPGVKVLSAPTPSQGTPSPFRFEVLEEKVGYVRLGSLNTANLAELDLALQELSEKTVDSLVLDLRATPAGGQFEMAAEVCQRFCPKGKILFTFKKPDPKEERLITSKAEPRFVGLLVVLVDADTSGAGEVIAGVLRDAAKAMLIGQKTMGEAAEFTELPLPSGKLLRVAVGRIELAGAVSLFPQGVKPDLVINVAKENTKSVLKAELDKGVKELVAEPDRPRLNEAALVAGTNPELEAIQSAQRARNEKARPVLHDVVLQRAFDFITTISVYHKKQAAK